jgi:membrane-associated phospholipid phosphatase
MNLYKLRINTFLLGYLPVLIIMIIILATGSKGSIHLSVNSYHTPFLDTLMTYWTLFGDGLLMLILIFAMLLVSFRYFFVALTAFTLSGVITQLFKRWLFSDLPRPVKHFEILGSEYELYLVPGVEVNNWFSFPSGHTATAFAVSFALALLIRSKTGQAALLLIAVGVGYSRVYLSQHFLVDVVAGSLLGILAGWLAWIIFKRIDRSWLDRSIYNLIRR